MKKKGRNISAVQEILESAYPVGTKRQRADGTYIKKSDGSWSKVQTGHNATHGMVRSKPHEAPVISVKASASQRAQQAIRNSADFGSALKDIVSQAATDEDSSMASEVGKLAYTLGHNMDSLYKAHGSELEAAGMWDSVVDAWHDRKAEVTGRNDTRPGAGSKLT